MTNESPDNNSPTSLPKYNMGKFVEDSYLSYAMYVVLDRALPQLSDGLKPVQRRILYAMHELSLPSTAKPKKAARTIGDVIGKYHPHGDAAAYGAMVHMAQEFSARYPLIVGQGNWGSVEDPSSFAAMRYTEAKLSSYADSLLREIDLGTVSYQDNFDATMQEPIVLPAMLPNILANGASGIAVGMSSNIPSHNACELIDACVALLNNPDATTEELLEIVPGPDFALSSNLFASKEDMLKLYTTGKGALQAEVLYRQEDKETIIIESLAPQTSINQLIEQIAERIVDGKIPDLTDIRDEGDSDEPVRIVLVKRNSRIQAESVMQQVFALTDARKKLRFNFNAIALNGKPQVLGIKDILTQWLQFRRDTSIRRCEYRLAQVNARLHILTAYLKAFDALDEVIHIIRTEDVPEPKLKALLDIDDIQVSSLLSLRLRQLAKLSIEALRAEVATLEQEKSTLEQLLSSQAAMTKLMKKQLNEAKRIWGDERRCKIEYKSTLNTTASNLEYNGPKEPMTVVLSAAGWVKTIKTLHPDVDKFSFKGADQYVDHCVGHNTDTLLVFNNVGKCFSLPPYKLPSGRGHGEPITKFIDLNGSTATRLASLKPKEQVLLATNSGLGFITPGDALATNRSGGKLAFNFAASATFCRPLPFDPIACEDALACFALENGNLLCYPLVDIPSYAPGGRGVKLIDTNRSAIVDHAIVKSDSVLLIHTGRASPMRLTFSMLQEQYYGKRSGIGKPLPRGYSRVQLLETQRAKPEKVENGNDDDKDGFLLENTD